MRGSAHDQFKEQAFENFWRWHSAAIDISHAYFSRIHDQFGIGWCAATLFNAAEAAPRAALTVVCDRNLAESVEVCLPTARRLPAKFSSLLDVPIESQIGGGVPARQAGRH